MGVRTRLTAALLAAAAAALVVLTLGSGQASAYSCRDWWPNHVDVHQGSPQRGPHCNGYGGWESKPIELVGHGRKPGVVMHGAPCNLVKHWAEPHTRNVHGVPFTFYYVWAKGHDYPVQPTILACSDEHLRVDQLTIGPGAHGASLPCPEIDNHHDRQSRPIENGVLWKIDSGMESYLTYVQGNWGHHHDGYWHYKLHNWWLSNSYDHVGVRLEGFCSYRT